MRVKPNDKPEYVNKLSNHPPQILKNIPIGINKRLANISANKEVFENSIQIYSNELERCDYEHKLSYENFINNNNNIEKPKRKRETSWFNPPFSKNVATKVGAKFLKIVDEKFLDQLKRYFNRNTVKLSYRCMPNIKNYIDRHNTKVMKTMDNNNISTERCNCQVSKKADCPLPGRCTAENVVYKATVR